MQIFDKFGSPIPNVPSLVGSQVLEAVDLSLAALGKSSFRGGDLYWVTFFNADLSNADFSHATMRGVDFKNADCKMANFANAQFLPDSYGLPCELQGADFSRANFECANFVCAVYDTKTQWPAKFNPRNFPGLAKA